MGSWPQCMHRTCTAPVTAALGRLCPNAEAVLLELPLLLRPHHRSRAEACGGHCIASCSAVGQNAARQPVLFQWPLGSTLGQLQSHALSRLPPRRQAKPNWTQEAQSKALYHQIHMNGWGEIGLRRGGGGSFEPLSRTPPFLGSRDGDPPTG